MRAILIVALTLGLLILAAWLGVKDALTPLARDRIDNPIYAVGEATGLEDDLKRAHIVVFGPAFWGQYPGTRVFASIDSAERYLVENNKVMDGWVIYQLSGDFVLDTYLENGQPHLNKSLVITRLVKKPSAFPSQVQRDRDHLAPSTESP